MYSLERAAPRLRTAVVRGLLPVVSLGLVLVACGDHYKKGVTGIAPPVLAPTTGIPVAYQALAAELDANRPSAAGQNSARTAPITEFETRLWQMDPYLETPTDILQYYEARMARVATEMDQPVTSGFRVWAMFNHGFIVKTPTATMAFDLVEGKTNWASPAWTVKLSEDILNRIDVLMVSHEHVDHWDATDRIPATIKLRGGAVLYPSGGLQRVSTTLLMSDKQVTQVKDLRITAHVGLHNAPVLIYEVVTGDGYRIVHTGDNQNSATLPALQGVDLLLLNGWVNEGGATTNQVGMKSSIEKLRPAVMIPGHFAEISRPKTGWYRFTDGLALQNDALIRTKTVVMTWGERMDYTQPACTAGLVRIYESCVVAPAQ